MSARSPRVAIALGAVALLVGGAVAPASAAGTTSGNPTAIRLYRQAASVMNHLPAYVVSQHGYVRIRDSIGRHRATSWAWGQDQFQPGEEATNEHLVLVQRDGRVAWLEDTLRPVRTCAQGGVCPTILPLEFVITPSADWVGIVSSGTSAACFTREPLRDLPYAAGGAWWFALGNYAAPVTTGPTTLLTARYPNSGQAETERDWMRTSTRRFTRSVFDVARSSRHRAFRFAAGYAALRARPAAPRITLCS